MAWAWSYTNEIYDLIRQGLREWSRERLTEAITDDRFEEIENKSGSLEHAKRAADKLRAQLTDASTDDLIDLAIEIADAHQTCTNGGWAVWIDREGYHLCRLPDELEVAD